MIAWISKEIKKTELVVDYENLKKIINFVKTLEKKNNMLDYVVDLFDEYNHFLKNHCQNPKLIEINIKNKLDEEFIDCSNKLKLIKQSKIILSSSHENTYYILKELNKLKNKKVLVICLDMHSDTYNYQDKLWKGNVFSKLIKEKYIDNLLLMGIPDNKIKVSKSDVCFDIKSKVKILDDYKIEKYLLKYKPSNVFISIDIDCFKTRKEKYTAMEYCPTTVLNNISHLSSEKINKITVNKLVEECIFVKNKLGYSNLYKVGENKIDLIVFNKIIREIKQQCIKNKINLGFNYKYPIMADITEINGYDYGDLTSELIIKLIGEIT